MELNGVTHDEVLAELADADLAIGKMKMGYYANAQVESLMAGVPTITYVRPEFMTDELRESGFIFATLDTLEAVIEHYLANPEALARNAPLRARASCGCTTTPLLHRRTCHSTTRSSSHRSNHLTPFARTAARLQQTVLGGGVRPGNSERRRGRCRRGAGAGVVLYRV